METLTSTKTKPSNGVTNGTNGTSHIPVLPSIEQRSGEYEVLDQYHSEESKIRVASVGAGASGLCFAYKMERMLTPGTWDLTLYEKNDQLGGTWYENTSVRRQLEFSDVPYMNIGTPGLAVTFRRICTPSLLIRRQTGPTSMPTVQRY
jgi:hypothetical protein